MFLRPQGTRGHGATFQCTVPAVTSHHGIDNVAAPKKYIHGGRSSIPDLVHGVEGGRPLQLVFAPDLQAFVLRGDVAAGHRTAGLEGYSKYATNHTTPFRVY